MKKTYFALAGLVAIIGGLIIWGIISYLPGLIGAEVNPTANIDVLESKRWAPIQAKTLSGGDFSLDSHKGKIVILGFWASWCAPCLEEFPSQLELAKQFPNDIVFVAVSADSAREDIDVFLGNFSKEFPANTFVIWDQDGKIAQDYKVGKLPENFIFDRNGKLSRKVVGSIDWVSEDAVSFFKKLISVQ